MDRIKKSLVGSFSVASQVMRIDFVDSDRRRVFVPGSHKVRQGCGMIEMAVGENDHGNADVFLLQKLKDFVSGIARVYEEADRS
jgi:hypothetical protein